MNRKVSAATLVGIAMAIVLGITGCTAPPVQAVRTGVPVSLPTPSSSPELIGLGSLSGTVLLRLENQHGGVVYGPYKRASERIAVDFNCVGDGTATVTIVGVGEFPVVCGGQGSSVRNVLDVRYVDSFMVRVDSASAVRWSLGVSEVH